MTDQELMEFAAKAHGNLRFVQRRGWRHVFQNGNDGTWWDPLNDDGDALRLAVKLGLQIFPDDMRDGSICTVQANDYSIVRKEICGNDARQAVRRAIVRVTAAIGQAMP